MELSALVLAGEKLTPSGSLTDEHHQRHLPRRVHSVARRFYLHRAGLELAV